jgi:hypothetical protein
MRFRTLSLLVLTSLLAAACGDSADDPTTTNQTQTTQATAEPVVLSYSLQPGNSYEYEVDLDQAIDLTSEGNTPAFGEDGEFPGEASLTIQGTTIFTYTVSEGPEAGTFEINIAGDFADLEFGGTVDGDPVDTAEIPDLAEMEPVDVSMVVDEQGNVVPDDTMGLGEDLFGGLGGLDMLEQFGSAATGQFLGPPLPEDEVTVGDTWSETMEAPALPGDDPITTETRSEIVAVDTIDGSDVFVIETTRTTGAVEFDLAELLIGFMSSFMPEDATDTERAELDALIDELRFAFSIDETVSDMTTWFDFEAGVTEQAEFAGDTHMTMDINIPDETTGEMADFALDMNVTQAITYRLIGA